MPANYSGVAANFDPTTDYTITQPVDFEAATAASEGAEHQSHADAIEWYRKNLVAAQTVRQTVTTWTLVQTFRDTLMIGAQRRIYMSTSGEIAIVRNASWDEGAALWTPDDATVSAQRLRITSAGHLNYQTHAAAASWNDAAWTNLLDVDTSGNLTAKALAASTGDVVALAGNLNGAHLLGLDAAPTVTGVAGVTPAVDGASTSTGGAFSLTAGGLVAAGKLATVTFAHAFPGGCFPTISAASDNGSQNGLYVWNRSATGFDIYSHTGLSASAVAVTYTVSGY